MEDGRIFLKVKVKSLAEEARIIRREEYKFKKDIRLRHDLKIHRTGIVRYEARHAQLALAFIRGMSYNQVERNAEEEPTWDKIEKMVDKHGAYWDYKQDTYDDFKKREANVKVRFEIWKKEAIQSRSVTVAQQTPNLLSEGSTPSDSAN